MSVTKFITRYTRDRCGRVFDKLPGDKTDPGYSTFERTGLDPEKFFVKYEPYTLCDECRRAHITFDNGQDDAFAAWMKQGAEAEREKEEQAKREDFTHWVSGRGKDTFKLISTLHREVLSSNVMYPLYEMDNPKQELAVPASLIKVSFRARLRSLQKEDINKQAAANNGFFRFGIDYGPLKNSHFKSEQVIPIQESCDYNIYFPLQIKSQHLSVISWMPVSNPFGLLYYESIINVYISENNQ